MRDASVGALSRVPAQALPAVPIAKPIDPVFTAIERDCPCRLRRIAQQDRWTEGSTAKGREVTQTNEDAHEAASGVGDDAVK